MTTLILQLVIGLLALGLAVFGWWTNANTASKKKVSDEDAKIDAASGADDIMRDSGEL